MEKELLKYEKLLSYLCIFGIPILATYAAVMPKKVIKKFVIVIRFSVVIFIVIHFIEGE